MPLSVEREAKTEREKGGGVSGENWNHPDDVAKREAGPHVSFVLSMEQTVKMQPAQSIRR
jgi:hypothetical protein